MADGFNKVMLLGNLGAEPELRFTQSGTPILKFRMATTESYLDSNKVRQERTEWHSVVMWGKRGEALSRILNKGTRIFVEGSLRTSSYEKDGEKRYRTEINATDVIFAGPRNDGARDGGGGGYGGGYGDSQEGGYGPPRREAGRQTERLGYGPHAGEDFGPPQRQEPAVYGAPPDDDFGNDDIPF